MANATEIGHQFEPRKEVTWEQGFGEPDRPAASGAFEAYPRHIYLDPHFLLQVGRRDMLMLRLGAEAKPGKARAEFG
jgi:hypothetical protein